MLKKILAVVIACLVSSPVPMLAQISGGSSGGTSAVSSVAGRTGAITLSATDIAGIGSAATMKTTSALLPFWSKLAESFTYLGYGNGNHAANIAVIGDSITYGTNSTPAQYGGYIYNAVNLLQKKYGQNSLSNKGFAFTWASASGTSLANTCTLAGTWSPVNAGFYDSGTGAYMTQSASGTGNTATCSFTGTSATLFFFTDTTTAAPAVTIDGATQAAPCSQTTSSITACSVTYTASGNGPHSTVITAPASGNVYFMGVWGTYSNNYGIGLLNAAVGSQNARFANSPEKYTWLSLIPNLDLLVYAMGENDRWYSSLTVYQNSVDALFSYAYNTLHVPILVIATQWPQVPCQAGICRADLDSILKNEAAKYGFPYISFHDHWGDYATASQYGLYSDDQHLSELGATELGDYVASYLGGYPASYLQRDAFNNEAIDVQSLSSVTTGTSNAAMTGHNTLKSITTGASNTAGGYAAVKNATTAVGVTGIGYQACNTVSTETDVNCFGQSSDTIATVGHSVELGAGKTSHTSTASFEGVPFVNAAGTIYGAGVQTSGITIGSPGVPTMTLTASTTGGTLAASAQYCYRIASTTLYGSTMANGEQCVTTGSSTNTNSITVSWNNQYQAAGYNLYGRTTGAELLLASNIGNNNNSTLTGQAIAYVDTGSVTPSGALPTSDTSTGGNVPKASQVGYILGTVSSLSRTTALGPYTFYTTSSTNLMYRVSATVACDAATSSTISLSIGYTDPSGTTQSASPTSSANCTTLGAGSNISLVYTFRAKGSTAVTATTTISGSPTYDITGVLEQMSQN